VTSHSIAKKSQKGAQVQIDVASSIGIRTMECDDTSVLRCTFDFPTVAANARSAPFAAGVLCSGATKGLVLEDSFFLATGDAESTTLERLFYGFVVVSSTQDDGVLTPSLDDAIIARNSFEHLAAAVLVNADVGETRIDSNRVVASHVGFWIEGSAFLNSSG